MSDIKHNSDVIFNTLSDRGILKVTGEDASKFLQSLITNDIYSSPTIYAMMLSPQGRYLFDFFISKTEDGYLIETDKASTPAFMARLKLYKLRAKVVIEDLGEAYSVYYSHRSLDIEKVAEYHDPRFGKLGLRTIAAAGMPITHPDLYLRDKYCYAIPDGGADLISDKSMPQEYGADHLHCIDYHKGCYVGQEFISRTKYQGIIRKQIFKVIGSSWLGGFAQGEAIVAGGDKVGVLCSAYESLGIGLVRLEDYEKHTSEGFYVGGIEVRLENPGWVTSSSDYAR